MAVEKALKAICDAGGNAIVIVNPYHGDHSENSAGISALLRNGFLGNAAISAGVLLRSDMTLEEATDCYDAHADHNPTIVHAGFTAPKALADHLGNGLPSSRQVFVEESAKLLYRKHFEGSTRILVRDGRAGAAKLDNAISGFSA